MRPISSTALSRNDPLEDELLLRLLEETVIRDPVVTLVSLPRCLAPGDNAHLDFPRIMHRVMLHGDVPVGVDGKPSEPITGGEPGRW